MHISTTATQEKKLSTELEAIRATWDKEEFTVIKHKESNSTWKLTNWDAIITTLDDSLASISDIQGSRYVKRLLERVEETHNMLILVSDTIEQWKLFQRNWLYLENIFASSKEIKDRCSKEWKEFEAIDKKWVSLMKKVSTKQNVKHHCTQGRLDEFLAQNRKMEEIQKKVEEYLDEKRTDFPRLYFISNDELLHLLSQSSIEGIEPQLNKLFDQLYRFQKSADATSTDLLGMISADGEEVPFVKDVKITPNKGVEVWLREIRDAMTATVQRKIRECHTDLQKTHQL